LKFVWFSIWRGTLQMPTKWELTQPYGQRRAQPIPPKQLKQTFSFWEQSNFVPFDIYFEMASWAGFKYLYCNYTHHRPGNLLRPGDMYAIYLL